MERLLKDAQEISGVEYDISNLNDVYEAIHVIQGELGITGTTAKEAGDTISGSIGMVKAAWDNLVTGLVSDSADIDTLIDDFVVSSETLITNIYPAFEKALGGVGTLVEKLGAVVIKELPSLAGQILPSIINTGTSLVNSLIAVLPSLITVLTEQIAPLLIENIMTSAPKLMEAAIIIVTSLATGLGQQLPTLVPMAIQAVLTIVQTLIAPENISMLIDAALQLIMGLADGLIEALPILIEALPFIIEELVSSLVLLSGKLTIAAIELMIKLAGGLIGAIPDLIKAIPQILAALVMGLIDGGAQLFEAGKDLLKNLLDGFGHDNPVLGKFKEWFNEIGDFWEGAWEWGADLVDNFVDGIVSHWKTGIEEIKDIAGDIADYIGFSEPEKGPLSNFHTFAPDMMDLFMKGVKDNEDTLRKQISSSFDIESNIKESAYIEPQGAPMGGVPLGYGSLQSTSERQPIYLQVGEEVFAKLVYNANIREGERVGVNLTEAVRV